MPTKKRGRHESDEEEGVLDQTVDNVKQCGNGHPLVLVPKEVRRLEKDKTWGCDGQECPHDWSGDSKFLDRARYRCVHYHSQGPCNYDLCGDCFAEGKFLGYI